MVTDVDLRKAIKDRYGTLASQVTDGTEKSCCSPVDCCGPKNISTDIYELGQLEGMPSEAVMASLGCGNPTALAELRIGETVLDLGSGGGIDVLLAAKRVGPTGYVYGLDMTNEMLVLARENQRQVGIDNVEFLKGELELIPLPSKSVDVVISNCVINLAADKGLVIAEAFRVLKAGGRLAVSDIVRRRNVALSVQQHMELWTGCLAGSLHESVYRSSLSVAGFEHVDIKSTRIYQGADARELLPGETHESEEELDGAFMSAFISAFKPGVSS